VNGQRPDANYFLVDGVSANLGTAGSGTNLGQGGAGQLPATSAFGGTSNLVSLDALEEFRIQTSTFAPEYGRTPGAQISVVTKSGTNTFHGTAFEYFRNDKLDANDWFANANGLARPELRQNDFGGVLGGPIRKDKLFFFGSYEGLRVRQPQVADTYVPSWPRARMRPQPSSRCSTPSHYRTGRPRQRNGRIFGQLLRSVHAEFFRHPDRLSAVAKSDHFRKVQRRSIEPRSARGRILQTNYSNIEI
jgi:hypothetical protein